MLLDHKRRSYLQDMEKAVRSVKSDKLYSNGRVDIISGCVLCNSAYLIGLDVRLLNACYKFTLAKLITLTFTSQKMCSLYFDINVCNIEKLFQKVFIVLNNIFILSHVKR